MLKTRITTLLAVLGAMLMAVSLAVAADRIQPTEASWADQVRGTSSFSAHPDAGKNRARATSAYGSMTYRIANQENLAKVEAFGRSEGPLTGAATGPITREVHGALLNVPARVSGTVCARTTPADKACSLDPQPGSGVFAQATSSELGVSSFFVPLVRHGGGGDSAPATATAACQPGQTGIAGLTAGGPVILGPWPGTVSVPIPAANRESVGSRTIGTITYTARIQRIETVDIGYAKSELRLLVTADGTTGDPWTLHVILASAECGMSRQIQENLPQPTATNFPLPGGSMSLLRSVGAPATDGQDPGPSENAAPEPTVPTTEPTVPTTEQTAATEGPQEPESVRIGGEFAVVNRNGVELGTATVEDVARTPGCGVQLTLSITTSAEAGPDRWASVAPDDVAEVRPGGSTREATTLSSDCEQAANSTTTSLSPGRDHEIVIAVQLDDSAQQAMLRPDGTAGWIFDLPPLTAIAVTTTGTAEP